MDSLIILVPLALLMGLLGLVAFLWNLRSGQYEDLDGAASRILFDDGPARSQARRDETPHPSQEQRR